MARNSLAERRSTFNQLSNSSRSKTAFQLEELRDKLEFVASLLARAEALSHVALTSDSLHECTTLQRHHYLTAIDELVIAANEQLDDVIVRLRYFQPKTKKKPTKKRK